MGPQTSSLPGLALTQPEKVPVPLAGTKEWNENCSREAVAKIFYCMVCDKKGMETNKQKSFYYRLTVVYGINNTPDKHQERGH